MENKNTIIDRINALEARMDIVNEKLDSLAFEYEAMEKALKAINDVEYIAFDSTKDIIEWGRFNDIRTALEDKLDNHANEIKKYDNEYFNISRELNPLIDEMYKVEA